MIKSWQVLMGMALLAATSFAVAGQSASWTCIEWQTPGGERTCTKYELKVRITTDQDVGRPGAFGIGIWLHNGTRAYWTAARGFEAYTDALAEPADGYYAALPAEKEFLVYTGTVEGLCSLSQGQEFTFYAAHGALMPEKEAMVNQLLAFRDNPNVVSPDHLRRVFIQNDVMQNEEKYGEVFSRTCNSNRNN